MTDFMPNHLANNFRSRSTEAFSLGQDGLNEERDLIRHHPDLIIRPLGTRDALVQAHERIAMTEFDRLFRNAAAPFLDADRDILEATGESLLNFVEGRVDDGFEFLERHTAMISPALPRFKQSGDRAIIAQYD